MFAGSVERPHCDLHIAECEDNKTVAPLIESKDDLVNVDHLPGSKSWHSEVSGEANLAGVDAADIKTGSTTSKYIVSTVHRSHLITLITKAIDTTSISYQHLWLCCWRGDISTYFYKKTGLFQSIYVVIDLRIYKNLNSVAQIFDLESRLLAITKS